MRGLTWCSIFRIASLLFFVVPTVVAPGCSSKKDLAAAAAAKKSASESGESDSTLLASLAEQVRLGDIPKLKLAQSTKVSAQETDEIKHAIRKLAEIDSPDFSLSGTLSGDTFLPIEGTSRSSASLFTNHQLKSSPELRKLVELGPKSLPFLLDALDDGTPTKLVINAFDFGVMEFSYGLSEQSGQSERTAGARRTSSITQPPDGKSKGVYSKGRRCMPGRYRADRRQRLSGRTLPAFRLHHAH